MNDDLRCDHECKHPVDESVEKCCYFKDDNCLLKGEREYGD